MVFAARRRPPRPDALLASQKPPPQRRPARLGPQPLVPEHQLTAGTRGQDALGMGMAPAARVAFGGDKHMLAQGGEMMTTDRTAIRRRLTVRRAAHRPPWGGRKTRHGSIVASVAATLAATVAVGVGVALAKAERDRRSARERMARVRQFALLPGERPGEG